jgi:hypothetical protein
MKKFIVLALLVSNLAWAMNPMGGSFEDKKTGERILLTCVNDEVAAECMEANFVNVKVGQVEVLHYSSMVPMDTSTQSHYKRYHMFYTLRDTLIMERSVGPQPWVIWNGIQIHNAFGKAVKIMFSKNEMDFNTKIKMSHGNFKKLKEIIRGAL